MRALVAGLLALALVATTAAPHAHVHAARGDECAVCTLHHTAPPHAETPDVSPLEAIAGEAAAAPGLPPVCGAPLGAVPGQSPPASA